MKLTRGLAVLSFLTLVFTLVWLIQMIAGAAAGQDLTRFEQVLNRVSRLDPSHYVIYINAAFITLFNTMLLTALYSYCKPYLPDWVARIGLVFVPVYCTMNMFAYLSQITIVPVLVEFHQTPGYQQVAEVLLRLTLQQWMQSGIGFFNNLAYLIGGIPSIIFGVGLYRCGRPLLRFVAIAIILSGFACFLGVAGILLKNDLLSLGSVVGGGLFTIALFPMTWAFFTEIE